MENVDQVVLDATGVRTPETIAAEIRGTILVVRRLTVTAIVQIGNCLIEAKELVQHGEWEKWLAEEVAFSTSTATRYMKIAREYREISNPAPVQDLSLSHALKLLSLSEDEREEIVRSSDVESLTREELDQEIEKLRARVTELERYEQLSLDFDGLQKQVDDLSVERDAAIDKAKEARKAADEKAKKKIEAEVERAKKDLEAQIESASAEEKEILKKAVAAAEERLGRVEKELALARDEVKLKLSLLIREIQHKVNDAISLTDQMEQESDRVKARATLRLIFDGQVGKLQ